MYTQKSDRTQDSGSAVTTQSGAAATVDRPTPDDHPVSDGTASAAGADPGSSNARATQNATPAQDPPQSLDDVAAQLAKEDTKRTPTRPSLLRSAVNSVKAFRIPALPHDAAGGSIHVRFKHHDAD